MKPSEKLKRLEKDCFEDEIAPDDIYWLIARVHRLTEALSFYATFGAVAGFEHPGDGYNDETLRPLGECARKALGEE